MMPTNAHRRRWLRGEEGFTIAEQLFAIALIGLLGVAVAAGIGVATRTYTRVRDVADVQSVLNDATASVCDELRYAYDIEPVTAAAALGAPASAANTGLDPGGAYAFESAAQDARVRIVNLRDGDRGSVGVQAISPSDVGPTVGEDPKVQADDVPGSPGTSVRPIAGAGGSVDVSVQVTRLQYDPATHLWTVELTAYKQPQWNGGDIEGAVCEATTGPLTVRAMNVR